MFITIPILIILAVVIYQMGVGAGKEQIIQELKDKLEDGEDVEDFINEL